MAFTTRGSRIANFQKMKFTSMNMVKSNLEAEKARVMYFENFYKEKFKFSCFRRTKMMI